jgi:hypothetical protein
VAVAARISSAKTSCSAASFERLQEDMDMTISPELEAQILRYYHAEKWDRLLEAISEAYDGL